MPDVHLKYGGSTAARTIICPGWHAQAAEVPCPPASASAQLGTALHSLMERALLDDDFSFESAIGQTVEGVEITRDHVTEKLVPAIDAFDELCKQYGLEEYAVETMVRADDDTGGTADVIAAGDDVVAVIDWKFGDGVIVSPVENAQGLFYTMCGYLTPEVTDLFMDREKILIVIIQPTNRDDAETLKVWETILDRVDVFVRAYWTSQDLADNATVDDHGLLDPSKECRFCPAQATCPAKTGLVEDTRRFPLESLALESLGDALDLAKELEDWIAAVRKMAHEQMDRGDRVKNWKLVNKRPSRVYTDEAAVENIVKRSRKLKHQETHSYTLLSPAQMEKVYKAKGLDFSVVEEHIAKVSSGTTIARSDDPRPEAPAVSALLALAGRTAG